ncbi:hypothetical protein BT93_L0306 [Corymbia citriodora subsp. variegata]|uniref:DUF6699 domain-containing protein n=1 Tax=Corymbia citriodora subsp. variegata TaxID=360336 RepID=A0A8T0CEN7_CORYI|nr:hypothetical protein BT93_L0306 [Corymbia citriodora subsp. variegata]
MSAEIEIPLSKVDSAITAGDASPTESKIKHRRTSSTVSGVFRIEDLEEQKVPLQIAPETQKLNWKLNQSPNTIDDKEYLKKLLVHPPVKKIDLRFPMGLEVTARNMKGVTIKDAMDAIHKQFKKKADDELGENPFLAGFEWDPEESYTRFIVHQKRTGEPSTGGSSKKKGKKDKTVEE